MELGNHKTTFTIRISRFEIIISVNSALGSHKQKSNEAKKTECFKNLFYNNHFSVPPPPFKGGGFLSTGCKEMFFKRREKLFSFCVHYKGWGEAGSGGVRAVFDNLSKGLGGGCHWSG